MSLKRTTSALMPAVLTLLLGCGGAPATDEHAHEPVTLQATTWSSTHELFLEYAPLVVGVPAELLIHVTDLRAGLPVASGALAGVWTPHAGEPFAMEVAAPERPGVYRTTLTPPGPGLWTLSLTAPGADGPADLPAIRVYGNAHAAQHADADADADAIVCLKEQQWRLGVQSIEAGVEPFSHRIRLAAVVEAPPGRQAELVAPTAGRLEAVEGRALPRPGDTVRAGRIVAALRAPLGGDGAAVAAAVTERVRSREALRLAELELTRARALVAAEAAPAKRVEAAEAALAEARVAHEAAEALAGDGAPALLLRAPIDGVVTAAPGGAGEWVAAGAAVLTILDASTVWVRGRVPEAELDHLPPAPAASLELADGPLELDPGALVALSPAVDPASRTAPVIYAVDNADGRLRVGRSVGLRLETRRTVEAVVVPSRALVDEQGRTVVFVHTDGEKFEKRFVEVGGDDGSRCVILSGLTAGERVVTESAWVVKLASADDAVPAHGHTH